MEDEELFIKEYSLAPASAMVIVDDFATYRLFQANLLTAPQEEVLENLYAALPMFLYFNSSLVKPLLEPLLEQQASSSYTSSFAASDIGE